MLPSPKPIDPIDLEALKTLKQLNELRGQELEPMVDVRYILGTLLEIVGRLNATIDRVNEYQTNNYDTKIKVVAQKLNQVVTVVNAGHKAITENLDKELQELDQDLPK